MFLLVSSCATTKKTSNNTISNAIVGENELVVLKRLGAPASVTHTADGGKIMVYEHYSSGPYLAPNKSNISNSASNNKFTKPRLTFTSNVNKAAYDPNSTIYQQNVSYLKAFIDKQGKCVRFQHDLPQEQLEVYQERFTHFESKD